MPKLPDAYALGARPGIAVPQAVQASRAGLIEADAILDLGGAVNRAAVVQKDREDKFAFAAAKGSLLQADIEARRELENDQDWATYETRYRERMGKAREQALGKVTSRYDRRVLELETQYDLERGAAEIRGAAKAKEVDWGRATLEGQLASMREAALNAKDEPTRATIVRNSQELIEGAVERGYVKAEEAGTVQRSWAQAYGEGVIAMLPAEQQIAMLKKPQGTPADFIDPAKRATLLETAEREQKQELRAQENEARAAQVHARQQREWAQDDARDAAQKHLAAGGTIANMPKQLWRSLDGNVQMDLQAWESASVTKLEKGRTDDSVPHYVEAQRQIELGNITDPSQLATYAPYLKDETIKTLDGVIRGRGKVSPSLIKEEFQLRKGKTEARWSDADREEYTAYQQYITRNVTESKRPEDLAAWADKWFMKGRTLKDEEGFDPTRYGEAVVKGRTDFVVTVPEKDRETNDLAFKLLWMNDAIPQGVRNDRDAHDQFYTTDFLEARRILANNGIEESPYAIAAVSALRAKRQPTTPANIAAVIDMLPPADRPHR